jgi:hypothetical protein
MVVRGQVITRGMDGVVTDISIPAIESAMRMYGVPDSGQWSCMNQVRRVFFHFMETKNGG